MWSDDWKRWVGRKWCSNVDGRWMLRKLKEGRIAYLPPPFDHLVPLLHWIWTKVDKGTTRMISCIGRPSFIETLSRSKKILRKSGKIHIRRLWNHLCLCKSPWYQFQTLMLEVVQICSRRTAFPRIRSWSTDTCKPNRLPTGQTDPSFDKSQRKTDDDLEVPRDRHLTDAYRTMKKCHVVVPKKRSDANLKSNRSSCRAMCTIRMWNPHWLVCRFSSVSTNASHKGLNGPNKTTPPPPGSRWLNLTAEQNLAVSYAFIACMRVIHDLWLWGTRSYTTSATEKV